MPPGGRPPSDDPRAPFNVRLSAAERATLEAAADAEGRPLATWAREELLAAAKRSARRRGKQ